ncbi:carph-isopro domain-containing protein [Azospirillum sp. TSA2s]|uniref:carph-isopro domain-containing protein n=1 Tax=Azospirillum sp. TSA2s TaxID=709810 RepID=UPI003527692E
MSYATNIIEGLGGTRKVARLLGLTPSTVQSWKDNGEIPAPRQRQLLGAARSNGLPLSADDFFQEAPPGRGRKSHSHHGAAA